MNRPITMGNCMFATWEQLDIAFDEWAKGYFGEHVRAEAAREENDCCLEIEGLEHKDFEKFSALFERFDKEGLYDPEYEFDTGVVAVQLPVDFARGILTEVYKDAGLRGVGSVQANDVGVFMMEKDLDYYKVMTGEYFIEQVIDGAEKHLEEIRDIEKYFASVNLGDYDLGGCEFTREDYELLYNEMVDGNLTVEEVVHEFLLGASRALVDSPEEFVCLMDRVVESWKDMQEKYPMGREDMSIEEEEQFVEDCYKLYEKEGFSPKYWSPFTDNQERVGLPVEIVGRIEADGVHDLSSLPMWKAKLDGCEFEVFPEEVVPSEMKANGCRWFDQPSLEDKIGEANKSRGDQSKAEKSALREKTSCAEHQEVL